MSPRGSPSPALTASSAPPPQLRRSPIKKVRKSLALDIVDEDGKLMMSSLPKTLSLVRGRETLSSLGSREDGSPWRPLPLGP